MFISHIVTLPSVPYNLNRWFGRQRQMCLSDSVTSVSRNQHRRLLPRTHDVMQGVAVGGSSSSTSRPAASDVVAVVPTLMLAGGVEKSTHPIAQGVERSTPEDMIRQPIVCRL